MEYAIDGGGAQDTGTKIGKQEPDATAKVKKILTGYENCQSHSSAAPDLSAAFKTFRDKHQKGHLALPAEITKLAKNTVEGSKTMIDGENVTTGIHKTVATTNQQMSIDVDTAPKG